MQWGQKHSPENCTPKLNIMSDTLAAATRELQKNGFLDLDVDPGIDLVAEINRLKKEKNAVILAHY